MRVQLILPDELVARVDERAGSRKRTEFVVRALESALGERGLPERVATRERPAGSSPPPASTRASGYYPLSSALAKAGVKPIPKKQ